MLAFVANTTASWETLMNTPDNAKNDRAQDLLVAAASADPAFLSAERLAFLGSVQVELECGAKTNFGNRFLTVLLRALSAWPA